MTAIARLEQSPPSPSTIARLAEIFESAAIKSAVATRAAVLLATVAPEPLPWFHRLVTAFESDIGLERAIADVLLASTRPELSALVFERLATGERRWEIARVSLLRALAAAGHPQIDAVLRDMFERGTSPWRRAKACCVLLGSHDQCADSRWIIDFVAGYHEHDFSRDESPGVRRDFEDLGTAMAAHAQRCAPCRRDWVLELFRFKRSGGDFERRALFELAPNLLAALTGAHGDAAVWQWLEQNK